MKPKMKQMLRRILSVMLLVGLTVNGSYVASAADTESAPKQVIIFHTNDMHGHLDEAIGIARVAAMKKNTENSLLVDAGDAIQGAPLATLSSGEDVVDLMNLAGYDVACTGNHEFDYGQEQLLKIQKMAEFPILAANVTKDGKSFLAGTYGKEEKENNGEYTLIEKNGVQIGFFGLTTRETRTSSNPSGLVGITFEDEVETAKKMIDTLEKEGADVIICLAHMGDLEGGSSYTAPQLAESLTGEYQGRLDAIIDGHSHTEESGETNGVWIEQTGTALTNLGKLTITYDETKDDAQVTGELIPEKEFAADEEYTGKYKDIVPDEAIEKELVAITESAQEILKQTIGETETTLWGGTINSVAEGRVTETNLGNLVADSMVDAGEEIIRKGNADEKYKDLPIVAMQNGGGIRATIKKGTITKGDIVSVLPYGNTISYKAVTPKLLYEIMETGVSGNSGLTADGLMAGTTASGGFPQIGGMKITYDPNKEKGSKVKAIYLDGETEPLKRDDESRQIIFGSNDFLIAGGSGYAMLKDLPGVAEGGGLDIMFENKILEMTENGTKPLNIPVTDGRIVVESDDYTPKTFTAYVEIYDVDTDKLAVNKQVSYYVDDATKVQKGTTDENGFLKLENLSDGAHTIGAVNGENEAYVCSYTGTGIILTFTKTYPQIKVDLSKQPADDQNADSGNTDSDTNTDVNTGTDSNTSTDLDQESGKNDAKKKTIKLTSVSVRKGSKKITGKVSVKNAKVKVKVGKKKYKKAKVSGKKFTFKCAKLKKGTKVKIKVTKKNYKTLTVTKKA